MLLAIALLVIAGLSVVGTLAVSVNDKQSSANRVFIVVFNSFAIAVEVLAALALMGS